MKKNRKKQKSPFLYYSNSEETVLRTDETQKEQIVKTLNTRRFKKRFLSVLSYFLAFCVVVSACFVAKKGIEKFHVLRQEESKNSSAMISEDMEKELEFMSEEERWAYLYDKFPELIDVKFPAGILYNYALYYANNPQTVGYLKVPGTSIDTPVVQADNDKYYLRHDFYGKSTSYGAIFASHIDDFQPLDRNTLLYGHNMNDGSRFAPLLNYRNLDFYKQHPLIRFDTLFEKNYWKVCAVILTNGSTEENNGYFFDFTFDNCSDACFEEYIEELHKRKLYDTGVDILPTDKLLTLCTCSYEFDNARLIVIARMVREGESTEVDTNLAQYKQTPVKYPECFYDNQRSNPYKDDKKFYLY